MPLSDREGPRDVDPEAVCPTCDGTGEVPFEDAIGYEPDVELLYIPYSDIPKPLINDLVPCPDCEE